ncbi:MAG: hypothetical protein AB7H77_07685 [Bdellovibrionales bacterium]
MKKSNQSHGPALTALAVFAFFLLACLLHPNSPTRTGLLFDTDDYMRLNQIINWLGGAGWFDLSHPRLSPGDNTVVHWSRLADLPIALVMLPLISPFGMQNAALVASFIVPPLLFAVLLMLMQSLARPMLRREHRGLAAVLLLFTPSVLVNYTPGRVDHHGAQIIIAAFGLLCLQRMILCRGGWKASIAAALAFACGLWIGTEALPWLILFIIGAACSGAWRGGLAVRHAAVFGLALPLFVAILLPLALSPQDYTSLALSWFSAADLFMALLAGAVFVIGWAGGAGTGRRWLRLALYGALGFFAAMLFAFFIPDVLNGPFADYDSFNSTIALDNIGEAQPLWSRFHISLRSPSTILHASLLVLHIAFLPLLALMVAVWNVIWGRRRAVWFFHVLFLIAALMLAFFWQVRVARFAQIFSVIPVAWLVARSWRMAAAHFPGPMHVPAKIVIFIFITALPVVLLPAAIAKRKLIDVVLFPAARPAVSCPLLQASGFLNAAYSRRSHVIMSGMNEGPELLFRTRHYVIAAPYNVAGNTDAYAFFNSRDDGTAQNILRRRRADLVLLCRHISLFYAGLGDYRSRFHAHLSMDGQGRLHMQSSKDHPTLIEKLVNGKSPDWLKPVEIPFENDYLLYEYRDQGPGFRGR